MYSENAQSSLLLSKLPTELRLLIWEFTLIEAEPVPFFTNEGASVRPKCQGEVLRNNIPALPQVNQAIRQESLCIYYRQNTFLVGQSLTFRRKDATTALLEKIRSHWPLISRVAMELRPADPDRTAYPPLIHFIMLNGQSGMTMSTNATASEPRPLTAEAAFRTDACICVQQAHGCAQLARCASSPAEFLMRGVADFGQLVRGHVYRVHGLCEKCEKGMLQLRPLRASDAITGR